MKAKLDPDAQERLAHIKQAAGEGGLPERIKLPSPGTLAQIAAGFGTHVRPVEAVRKAASLYLHALAFTSKHHHAPVLDVARACDDELASRLSHAAMLVSFKRTHLLKPDERQDEARQVLAKDGLRLRTAKSVLENLRQCNRLAGMRRFLRAKSIQITWQGKPLWAWGTPTTSEFGDDQTKLNEARKLKCRMVTQKEYDARTETIAKKHDWRDGDHELEWKRGLASHTKTLANGRVVYHLPATWLGELRDWKKSLKHTGGVKSRQTKKSSKKP